MARKPKQEVSDVEEGSQKEPSSSVSESNPNPEAENSHIEEAASNGPKKETPESKVPGGTDLLEVDASDIASMTSGLPEPNQNAIDAEKAKNAGKASSSGSGIMSENKKEEFDPSFHATDKDGNPIPTKAGGFRRKPGRKSSRLNSSKEETKSSEPEEQQGPTQEELIQTSAFAATQATAFGLNMALAMKPNRDESKALHESYVEYYRFAGPTKIPAWLAPVLVTGSIINNHLEEEAPKSRIEKIKEWIGVRLHRMKKGKVKNETSK